MPPGMEKSMEKGTSTEKMHISRIIGHTGICLNTIQKCRAKMHCERQWTQALFDIDGTKYLKIIH
jgi:hypothetical protein